MDLHQLECFRAVAEAESLTRAAEALHVSQPAVSALLKRLEGELGTELFDRSPNRVKLNAAGELALRHTVTILRDVEAMQNSVADFARENQTLSIAFCDPGVQWWTVPRFSMAHPEVTATGTVYQSGPAKLLLERECTLLVTPEAIHHPKVENVPFLPDRVYLSVPPESALARQECASLRDIPAQPVLLPTIGGHFIETIERILAAERPDITVIKHDFLMTQHMVRTTNFLATLSTLSMELRNDGDRRFVPLTDPELNVVYQIAFLRGEREKVRQFLVWAKSVTGPS
jgi:DNA-binding transcriptional LysR family regulator